MCEPESSIGPPNFSSLTGRVGRDLTCPIWASEDLKIGLASFRENGPGLAKFTGR